MANRMWQLRKICCNVIAWMLIWIMGILAIPAAVIMLLMYGVRSFSDKVIRRTQRGLNKGAGGKALSGKESLEHRRMSMK